MDYQAGKGIDEEDIQASGVHRGFVPAASDSRVFLSIVVPVKNEEEAILPFVQRVAPILEKIAAAEGHFRAWEILFIDDGSTDCTLAAIQAAHGRDPRVRALSLSRNFGKEAALSAGLDHVRGAAIVPIDVDMQDPPELLPEMVAKWRAGFEVVYGVRVDRETDGAAKRWTANFFYKFHNWLSQDQIPAHAGDFRLLDRAVVDVIRSMPERNRFMKGLFAWAGFRAAPVEYRREERTTGASKFNYWKLWTLALDGITSASTVPLRVWSYIGVMVALAGLAYAGLLIIRTLAFGVDVPGYSSLMVTLLVFGGLQLISLGVLGEYVGRILIETKHRPLYVIRTKVGADD
jgi:glycosyltransferase involved in cell wall biosynthesis